MADGNKENGNGVSCKTIHSKVLLKITVKINFLQNYNNGSSKKQAWKLRRQKYQVNMMLTGAKRSQRCLTLDSKGQSYPQ